MMPRTPDEEETTEEIEEPEQTLAETKKKAEDYLANWQRAQADLINYKRRSDLEKEEIGKFAKTQLMLTLLPILDDLERAFDSMTPEADELNWIEGIRLIERKLRAGLGAQGLSRIEALGKPFDPNFHEAVMHGKGEEGIVIEELQKGYKLHDRVIRPTKVVVGNGEEGEQKEE